MFSLAAFAGYLIGILLINGYFKSFIVVLIISSYLFYYEFQQYKSLKNILFRYLLSGIFSGFLYLMFTMTAFSENPSITDLEMKNAKIFSTTEAFYYMELNNSKSKIERFKIKKAAISNLNQREFFVFDSLTIRCSNMKELTVDNVLSKLERLRKIHYVCHEAIILDFRSANPRLNYFRENIRQFVLKRLNNLRPDSYAAGFLLSENSTINKVEMKTFRNMGVAHLFSPSGLHMGLLYGTCVYLSNLIKVPVVGQILGIFFCFIYIIILDFRISILRAFLFLILYGSLKFLKRKIEGRYVLYLTTILLEIIFPFSCFSISFILSFFITLVIILLYPRHKKTVIYGKEFWKQHLSLTLSASAASCFLSMLFFGYFHPLSVFYNLLMVPLAGIYLSSAFLYLAIPVFKYIVYLVDFIYRKFSLFHYILLEKTWPGVNPEFAAFWLILFFFLLIYFIYFSDQNKYWFLRKYYFKIYAFLGLIFIGNYFTLSYPDKAVFAFPYGVIYYKNHDLFFDGNISKFYIRQFNFVLQNLNLPFRNIYCGEKLKETLGKNFIHPDYKFIPLDRQPEFNSIIFYNDCFIFLNKKSLNKFKVPGSGKIFKTCKTIYLVHPKNYSPDTGYYKKVFTHISPDSEISELAFMKWYFIYDNKNKFPDNISDIVDNFISRGSKI